MVYIRGVLGGSNRTLWCAGVAIEAGVVVTSAMCIGTFVEFRVYADRSCAAAAGSPSHCTTKVRQARLLAAHPSVRPYERAFKRDAHPLPPCVDLLVRIYLNELKQPHATALALGTIFVYLGTLTRKAAYLPRTDRGITPSHPTVLQLRRRRRRGGCSSRRLRRGP